MQEEVVRSLPGKWLDPLLRGPCEKLVVNWTNYFNYQCHRHHHHHHHLHHHHDHDHPQTNQMKGLISEPGLCLKWDTAWPILLGCEILEKGLRAV